MTTKAAILQAVRAKCLDCSCYQPSEVRQCPVTRCALWVYRFGKDPEPSRGRGFAKSSVYTDGSKLRTGSTGRRSESLLPRSGSDDGEAIHDDATTGSAMLRPVPEEA